MHDSIEILALIVSVVAALVGFWVGSIEVASLREETGDKSRLLSVLSFGRRMKHSTVHHRHEPA